MALKFIEFNKVDLNSRYTLVSVVIINIYTLHIRAACRETFHLLRACHNDQDRSVSYSKIFWYIGVRSILRIVDVLEYLFQYNI